MARVTLTFDCSADPYATPRVLDVLGERGVSAHFFARSELLDDAAHRLALARARDDGHLIGNHGVRHDVALGDDPRPEAAAAQIGGAETVLGPLLRDAVRRFRPFSVDSDGLLGPHLLSPAAISYLVLHGYTCVLWNSAPPAADWRVRALADCEALPHACLALDPAVVAAELDRFLAELADRGAQLTTDLPASCAPIVAGRIIGDLSAVTRAAI